MTFTRRNFIKASTATVALGTLSACVSMPEARKPVGRVVVIGAGFGGATAAKYLRMWSDGAIDVVLIERNREFISCPTSNLVLGGTWTMADITRSYQRLTDYGVKLVQDVATAVDTASRQVRLERGDAVAYDRLVMSPGIDFLPDQIQGYDAGARKTILHAWKAGPQTVALRKQLEDMRDGGVYVLSIPLQPYRCPPGPYERACQIASYFKRAKPKSKIIILDANQDVTSKGPLFKAAWRELYGSMIEYRPNSAVTEVEAKSMSVKTDFDTVRGEVLNVVPPHRAADIAKAAGLITGANRWCGVNWQTMESVAVERIHVLGDATLPAATMPKSGHLANQQAKVAAAAIIELMNGRAPPAAPLMNNTCYSDVSDKEAIHVVAVYAYDPKDKTMKVVPGSGGLSPARSELEAVYARSWAQNIWNDMLG